MNTSTARRSLSFKTSRNSEISVRKHLKSLPPSLSKQALMNAGRMRLPRNPSRPIVTWHRGSARAKIKQRAAPSKFRGPPSNCQLSLSPRSFYGEASSTIATPYTYNDDLRRDPGESPGPQGGGT